MHRADAKVSVVVPTMNSADTLLRCLESIKSQDHTNLEIIVVDRFSSDQTISIAKQYADHILQNNDKRSKARNQGAGRSDGRYLLFVDSDMELGKSVVRDAVFLCETEGCDSVIVPEISFGAGFWSKCIALEKKIYLQNATIESPCFFRRECFVNIGGYDERLEAGEDWDIFARFKEFYKVGRIQSIIRHNEGKPNLKKLFLKKYYYGHTIQRYVEQDKQHAKIQLSPIRFINRSSLRAFHESPCYWIGLIFMKSIQFIALTAGSRFARD